MNEYSEWTIYAIGLFVKWLIDEWCAPLSLVCFFLPTCGLNFHSNHLKIKWIWTHTLTHLIKSSWQSTVSISTATKGRESICIKPLNSFQMEKFEYWAKLVSCCFRIHELISSALYSAVLAFSLPFVVLLHFMLFFFGLAAHAYVAHSLERWTASHVQFAVRKNTRKSRLQSNVLPCTIFFLRKEFRIREHLSKLDTNENRTGSVLKIAFSVTVQ